MNEITDFLDRLMGKYAPVAQFYKAEAAAVGFTVVSTIGAFLNWSDQVTAIAAVIVGYGLAYVRSRQ